MGSLLPVMLSLACQGDPALSSDPTWLDWGRVDFQDEECFDCACEQHCAPTDVSIENVGRRTLTLSMPEGYDTSHVCVAEYDGSPVELGTLDPGAVFELVVSVCGYVVEQGQTERDSRVEGGLRFEGEPGGQELVLPWSFTPVRDQAPVDTGA